MGRKMKSKSYYAVMFKKCRQFWSQSDTHRKECLKKSEVIIDGLKKYSCTFCQKPFARSEIDVDHIAPISITPESQEDFIKAINLLHTDKLQILCKKCHSKKTISDNNKAKIDEGCETIQVFLKDVFPNSKICLENINIRNIKFLKNWISKYFKQKEQDPTSKKLIRIKEKIDAYLQVNFF